MDDFLIEISHFLSYIYFVSFDIPILQLIILKKNIASLRKKKITILLKENFVSIIVGHYTQHL